MNAGGGRHPVIPSPSAQDRPEDYDWSSYKVRILGKKDKLLDELSL